MIHSILSTHVMLHIRSCMQRTTSDDPFDTDGFASGVLPSKMRFKSACKVAGVESFSITTVAFTAGTVKTSNVSEWDESEDGLASAEQTVYGEEEAHDLERNLPLQPAGEKHAGWEQEDALQSAKLEASVGDVESEGHVQRHSVASFSTAEESVGPALHEDGERRLSRAKTR